MNNILFNSSFELGIRMVFLLREIYPSSYDLHDLCFLDYALIYSEDLGGPPSLHTPVPLRGGEYLTRKQIIEDGLIQMSKRQLIEVILNDSGISYSAGENANVLVELVNGDYSKKLQERASWASNFLDEIGITELKNLFKSKGLTWGAHMITSEQIGK